MSDHAEFYAYGVGRRDVESVMRLQAVKRWHMIDTTRIQTLAEHSANVGILCFMLAYKAPHMFFGPACYAAMHGLLHDMGEVFTGDVPTPTKQKIDGLDDLEHAVLPAIFHKCVPSTLALLTKMCDLADGIRFIRLHGVDVTGAHARTGLESQLLVKKEQARKEWPPEVFDYVLDQLGFYAYEGS